MNIQPITNLNLNFKSERTKKQEKIIIRTPAQFSKWIKEKEPLLFDVNESIQIWRQLNSSAEYMRKRGQKHIEKESCTGDTINGNIKKEVDTTKALLNKFKEHSIQTNNYYYNMLLSKGLNEYVGRRFGTGLYEIKSPANQNEIAILQHNKKKNYFKIVINDSENKPLRWYFFVNDFYVKSYNPAEGFKYFKCKFGKTEDIESIKNQLIKDLGWIKEALIKSCQIMSEQPKKIKLLK